jgi:N-acetyl-anhydromuramyl-L-alanine amidase AmpD
MKENKNFKKSTKDKKNISKKEDAKEILDTTSSITDVVNEPIKTIEEKTEFLGESIENDTKINDSIEEKTSSDELMKNELNVNSNIEITKIELSDDKYFKEKTEKKQIVLHTTGTDKGLDDEIKTFVEGRKYFTTHYIIDRDGKIYQLVDDEYWAYHLNIAGHIFNENKLENLNKQLEMNSISIELDSLGELHKVGDNKYRNSSYYMTNLTDENVTKYKDKYFESYTEKQLSALEMLLKHLSDKHDIDFSYKGDEIFSFNLSALKGESGIYTEASYNKTKNNTHPQPELIDILKKIK